MITELTNYWFELLILSFVIGFGVHMGVAIGSYFLQVKIRKEITYDNLDKNGN